MNVVDIGQTVQIARSPGCYREIDPVTSLVLGSHPSESGSAGWLTAEGIAFYYAEAWLDSQDTADALHPVLWRSLRLLFTGYVLIAKAQTIYQNNKIGLHPFGGADTGCRG